MGYESKVYVIEKLSDDYADIMCEIDLQKVCYGETGERFKNCFDTDLSVNFYGYIYNWKKESYDMDYLKVDSYGAPLKCCKDKTQLRIIAEKLALECEENNHSKWLPLEMLVEVLKLVEDKGHIEIVHYGY